MRQASHHHADAYRDQGFRFPIDALAEPAAQGYRAKLEAFEAEHGRLTGGRTSKLHLMLTWMDELIRLPAILDAVEGVLGPDILCWSSAFFIKEARDPSYISWHQDGTYWGLSAPDVATAWLALSPATVASGCMKFVPGSHLAPVGHRDTFAPDNALSRGQEVAVEVDENDAVHVVLRPGQASLHHVLLFHASEPNGSDDRRIGLAIRYVAPHVRQLNGKRDSAMLVRGRDVHGHFEPEPRPTRDMAPDAVALHDQVTQQRKAIGVTGAPSSGQPATGPSARSSK